MLELLEKIKVICKNENVEYDLTDIGCTLTLAMHKTQRQDLMAMIEFFENTQQEEIAVSVFHDLQGFKRAHFDPKGIHAITWLPRSHDYRYK